MATTQDYINQLKIDKQNLVSMLNNMGVEANNSETFTSLTPKVGKIVTDPILQDKSVEITENGTQTIQADKGYDGLNNVDVTVNVPVGEIEVKPDYITDGLIAWFDGEDDIDDNHHWVSRIDPTHYIYTSGSGYNVTLYPYAQLKFTKTKNSIPNNTLNSYTTNTDYYVQGYTVEVVGRITASGNSSDKSTSNLTGGPLFGIGRTQSVYVSLCTLNGKLRIFNEPNDKALPEPHDNLLGKTFACAIHFEQTIPRSATSGTDIVNYAFNGGKYNRASNTVTTISKNNNACNVLSYYIDGYRSSGEVNCIRIYNRKLTEEEIAYNFAIDKARFKIEE